MNVADACEFASLHPVREWPREVFESGIFKCATYDLYDLPMIADALVRLELFPSKGQARKASFRVNGVVAADRQLVAADMLFGKWVVLTRGKHDHAVIEVAPI